LFVTLFPALDKKLLDESELFKQICYELWVWLWYVQQLKYYPLHFCEYNFRDRFAWYCSSYLRYRT
jgi:hypothetical protein